MNAAVRRMLAATAPAAALLALAAPAARARRDRRLGRRDADRLLLPPRGGARARRQGADDPDHATAGAATATPTARTARRARRPATVGVGALRAKRATTSSRGTRVASGSRLARSTVDSRDERGPRRATADRLRCAPSPMPSSTGPATRASEWSAARYGGGIQLVVAGIDYPGRRHAPDIAWHSLAGPRLYKDRHREGRLVARCSPTLSNAAFRPARSIRTSVRARIGWSDGPALRREPDVVPLPLGPGSLADRDQGSRPC